MSRTSYERREMRAHCLASGHIETTHGTLSTYTNYKCRCEPCRDAKNVYERKRYAP